MGYWSDAEYRLEDQDGERWIMVYDASNDEWQPIASVEFIGSDTILLTNPWGDAVEMERISDDELDDVLAELEYQPLFGDQLADGERLRPRHREASGACVIVRLYPLQEAMGPRLSPATESRNALATSASPLGKRTSAAPPPPRSPGDEVVESALSGHHGSAPGLLPASPPSSPLSRSGHGSTWI